ncbi:hypothetical protein HMPREF3213_01568 [Heyndrickxia coagulans]|uniref:Uncharacterized protein n=1 Tax=Heyndrickxia coagulans TaxID=1398 RepID=A0A133KTB8_HEYCO|nr:hypothetical protein HMPREF3213_01568 [Heyndrickxia coagulans]
MVNQLAGSAEKERIRREWCRRIGEWNPTILRKEIGEHVGCDDGIWVEWNC